MLSKKSSQLNISVTPQQAEFLEQISQLHCIPGPALVRGLIEAASAFYKEHGWFSFPVTVAPLVFQGKTPQRAVLTGLKAEVPQGTKIPTGIRKSSGGHATTRKQALGQ